jgi:DNA-binding transcriptional LysR family regulator
MDLRQLRYFLTLAEELHFRKAAEKLFIVQPALTKQIQDLEKELGTILFDRNKRTVRLSAAGVYFKEQMTKFFQDLEDVKKKVRLVEKGIKGELRIGYVGSCIHTFLPDLLSKLHDNYPEIQTYLSEMTSASQLLAIQKGELDVAFLRNPPLPKESGFGIRKKYEQRLIFQENFSLIVPKNHFLNEKKFKKMSQLANEKFILPTKSDGELYHKLQWSICEDAGFTPQIAHETVHGYTTIKLVEKGLGVSLLPTSFKTETHAAITFIELKNIPQKSEITALWLNNNSNPSLNYFLDLISK